MALHSMSPGTYTVKHVLQLIIFINCYDVNNKRMETVHSGKEFLLYTTIEIAAITEVTVEKNGIL